MMKSEESVGVRSEMVRAQNKVEKVKSKLQESLEELTKLRVVQKKSD